MEQDFFTNLPPKITIDILSRLPVPTIVRCKCVRKSWLHLLETREFVNIHLSKSVPGLAVYQFIFGRSHLCGIFDFEDGLGFEHHELHYNPVLKFTLPHHEFIQGSANGLLFLRDQGFKRNDLYICNPIMGEIIKLHCPEEFDYKYPEVVTFGFGVSKTSGQHKVVRIFHDGSLDQGTYKSECHVYTLGTGSWRRIEGGAPLQYSCLTIGAFLNGNLHWLVYDLNKSTCIISCFNLETELFIKFCGPPPPRSGGYPGHLSVLGDCLCLSDNTSEDEIVIWLMKEYGDEKFWTKEFVINKGDHSGECYEVVRPIKVFKDGDILMAWQELFLFYYSNKTKTIKKIDIFKLHGTDSIDSILHTSSFLSLKSFSMEKVISF